MKLDFTVRRRALAAMEMGQQVLVYDVGSRTLYKLDRAAADVWHCTEHPIAVEKLARHLSLDGGSSSQFEEEIRAFVQRFAELFVCGPGSNEEQHELPPYGAWEGAQSLTVEVFDELRLRQLYPDLINNPVADFGDKWPGCIAPASVASAGG